jgi:hypothetical protein
MMSRINRVAVKPQQKASKHVRIMGLCVAILCFAVLGLAQSTNSGDIRGTVTDASGAVVPGAKITILNVDTGVQKEYLTNAAGLYDTVSILPGRYKATFFKEGFSTLVREGITLEVGAPLTVDAQLTLGTAQQQVQVTAEAALLKTETPEQSTSFQAKTMAELPNVTRSWTNFTKTLPGVVGTGSALTVNGTMPYYANFMADGASTTLPHSANVDLSNFEAIAEVQINTSTFSAQYGTGAVVYNQISKSGSNQWHGSAYEFLQNNAFNARSFFSPSVPLTKVNNFGGSVSGPIRKDRLFFFYNAEKIINHTTSYRFFTFPTADMRAGNFSNSAFPTIYDPTSAIVNGSRTPFPGNSIPTSKMDPLALAVQKYFPTPVLGGSSTYVNNLNAALVAQSPWMKHVGRADYQISDRNRLTMSVTKADNPNYTPSPGCPIDCYTGDVDSYAAQISDVWNVSATLVNEFRIGYVREDDVYTPQDNVGKGFPQKLGWTYAKADMFPSVTINGSIGGTNLGTTGNNVNAHYAENGIDPSDTVTLIRGKHILHFGAELLTFQDNDAPWSNIASGNFTFSGNYTRQAPNVGPTVGYADFLLGLVSNWSATNSPINAMRQISPQFFVQDDFKVRPNLTVNIGLRYQIQGGWYERHNQLGTFDPMLMNPKTNTLGAMWFSPNNGRDHLEASVKDIILPRIGVAWSAKPNMVLRGGFGIYSYGWSQDTYVGGAEGFGANFTGNMSDNSQNAPLFRFSDPNPQLIYVGANKSPDAYNGLGVGFIPYHTPVTRNYQWSLSVQRQLPGSMVGEVAYVGNHVTDLPFPADINQVPSEKLGQLATVGLANVQSLRPFPAFLGVGGGYFHAISNYHSLQLSVKKRFSHGATFDANYTFSKLLSEQDSSGWSGNGGTQTYQDSYHLGSNYGFSNLDRTHMFKGNVVYQIPIGKGHKVLSNGGPLDWVVGGWQASSLFVVQSGSPYTPTMANNNAGAQAGTQRPNVVGDPTLSSPTIQQWFNPAAFAQPTQFTWGNAGRNMLRGPGYSSIDFSMAKTLVIPKWEKGRVQIRLDSTNVINHTSFANPNASILGSSAGRITGTTVSGRTVQLGARFSF